mgnify:CR=1 FL=1
MSTLSKALISLVVSLIATLSYMATSDKKEKHYGTYMFGIAVGGFFTTFLGQTLMFGSESALYGGGEHELGTMLQNIESNTEVPF